MKYWVFLVIKVKRSSPVRNAISKRIIFDFASLISLYIYLLQIVPTNPFLVKLINRHWVPSICWLYAFSSNNARKKTRKLGLCAFCL